MTAVSPEELRLFPLYAVLFPGGVIELKVFEPRYFQLVTDCLRHAEAFGICLIREGQESGPPARVFDTGTEAVIVDWDRRDDGLLAIVAQGRQRFDLSATRTDRSGLSWGQIARWRPSRQAEVPAELRDLAARTSALVEQMGGPYRNLDRRPDDAGWVADRLAELLPIPLTEKQSLLDMDDPVKRLRWLNARLNEQPDDGRES